MTNKPKIDPKDVADAPVEVQGEVKQAYYKGRDDGRREGRDLAVQELAALRAQLDRAMGMLTRQVLPSPVVLAARPPADPPAGERVHDAPTWVHADGIIREHDANPRVGTRKPPFPPLLVPADDVHCHATFRGSDGPFVCLRTNDSMYHACRCMATKDHEPRWDCHPFSASAPVAGERPEAADRCPHGVPWDTLCPDWSCQKPTATPAPEPSEGVRFDAGPLLLQVYSECLTPIAEAFGYDAPELDDGFVEFMKERAAELRRLAAPATPPASVPELADMNRLVRYVVDQEMFTGRAQNACGGCSHADCLSNEKEFAEMGQIFERLARHMGGEKDGGR